MAICKSPLIWTASLAAVAAGSLSACGDPAAQDSQTQTAPDARSSQEAQTGATAEPTAEQQAEAALAGEGGGEGGEGGEGGAGGEFGIDPALAGEDPVIYISAVEVMRAHYLAGLAALDAGDRMAASAMFSHPVSEIYVDFEPMAVERGAASIMEQMNRAAVLHFQEASDDEIRAAVRTVMDGLDATEAAAPAPRTSQAQVDAEVILDLAERAALQYGLAMGDAAGAEAWLDAYGFNAAAQAYAGGDSADLAEAMPGVGGPLSDLLVTLETALGDYQGPAEGAPSPEDVDAAVAAYRGALLPEGDEATSPY